MTIFQLARRIQVETDTTTTTTTSTTLSLLIRDSRKMYYPYLRILVYKIASGFQFFSPLSVAARDRTTRSR